MEVAAMCMHSCRTKPCPGWVFGGSGWTEKLKESVGKLFGRFLEYEQCRDFNYWHIVVIGDSILASRFTWQNFWIGGNSLQKLEEGLKKEYPDWKKGKASTLN